MLSLLILAFDFKESLYFNYDPRGMFNVLRRLSRCHCFSKRSENKWSCKFLPSLILKKSFGRIWQMEDFSFSLCLSLSFSLTLFISLSFPLPPPLSLSLLKMRNERFSPLNGKGRERKCMRKLVVKFNLLPMVHPFFWEQQ